MAADGQSFIGSVSAGCVEHEVIELAHGCLLDGRSRWASFGPSQSIPWEIALTCGGRISVRVDPFTADTALRSAIAALMERHEPAVLACIDHKQLLIGSGSDLAGDAAAWSAETISRARELLAAGAQTCEELTPDGRVLFRVLGKPKRLFIVGAVHIATHLAPIARALNLQVIVIDPREVYANIERFPSPPDQLLRAWPGQSLDSLRVSAADAAVLLTHDPKIDDDALESLLRSECGYIGALGSRKSHEARLKRLAARGFTSEQTARIHGPVGIDIGSRTPAEIAVSIAAEIIQTGSSKA